MILRWLVGVLFTLALGCVSVASWVVLASEWHFRSFDRPAAFALAIPSDAAALSRGDHLVRTRGCRGCHGEDLAGQVMWGYAVAPNLPALARSESGATLEAAIRHGIGRDGRALFSMPSYNFVRLRDTDMADMLAYLRSVPVVEKALPGASLPWSVRFDIARGKDAAMPAYVPRVPPLRRSDDPDPRMARGEYLAMTTCNECHGLGLRADSPWEGETAPDLVVIRAYDEAAFRRLMRLGIALGERELPMMSPVARGRFAHFSDEEVADVFAFLTDMSARAAAAEAARETRR
ncbi:MAG: c-type cytochrome [Betaproteobacteria bacterium]|nr:c-type cytochrome [Betaproteobacteria bacterium]